MYTPREHPSAPEHSCGKEPPSESILGEPRLMNAISYHTHTHTHTPQRTNKPAKQPERGTPLAEPTRANTRAGLPGKEGMRNEKGMFVFPCCYC